MSFGGRIIGAATAHGASAHVAANAVWALIFTAGGVVNCAYCAWLIFAHGSVKEYFGPQMLRNSRLAALMSILWISSFYLYGAGSSKLGGWGVVAGWPLFISLSIGTGVLWGLRRGEWEKAPPRARVLRNWGLVLLFAAVLIIAASNLV
jgi:hypothetical protein